MFGVNYIKWNEQKWNKSVIINAENYVAEIESLFSTVTSVLNLYNGETVHMNKCINMEMKVIK